MSYKNKIETYLKSGRRGKTANQLERDAMDDLFLNDALDGYTDADSTHTIANIDKLEKMLEQRVEKRSNRTFIRWMAASAAVLLVFITGYQFLNTTDNNIPEPKSQLAVSGNHATEKQQTTNKPATKQDTKDILDETLTQGAIIQQDIQAEKKSTAKREQNERLVVDDLLAVEQQEAEQRIAESIEVVEDKKAAERNSNRYIQPLNNNQLFVHIDTAINSVIDNAPKVAEFPTTLGTLQGTSVTRQSGAVIDGPDGFNKFIDKEQQLENAITTGYSSSKRKSVLTSSANSHMFDMRTPATTPGSFPLVNINKKELEPVTGMDSYKQYLKEQLNYPTDAAEQKKEGRVMLSFLLNNEGRPYDIKVERSLSQSCDAEAIRLLSEGVSWNPASGTSQKRIKLKIEFKLNK